MPPKQLLPLAVKFREILANFDQSDVGQYVDPQMDLVQWINMVGAHQDQQ
jgi:hypothetical protein